MSVLIGQKAIDFTTAAVLANGEIVSEYNLYKNIAGKYACLVFYPLDFTFVCPTELIAIHRRIHAFKEKSVEVIGISVDSAFTHNAWRETAIKKGGVGKVDYTLVSDVSHKICHAYGVEHPEMGVAFRGSFLIDKTGIIRVQNINDLPIGRSIDELLRLIDALQFHDKYGEVCPANWQEGAAGMKATPQGVASYLEVNANSL